jgi:hypothetical protein
MINDLRLKNKRNNNFVIPTKSEGRMEGSFSPDLFGVRFLDSLRSFEMTKTKLIAYSIIGLFLYSLIGLFNQARADFSLGVYPPITQIEVTPPNVVDSQISVENTGNDVANLKIKLKAFKSSSDNNGQIEFLKDTDGIPGNDPLILQKMAIFDGDQQIDTLTLAPKQIRNVTLHIELPKDEPSGDYYFSIVFQSSSPIIDQDTGSAISGGVATNVILSIGPKTKTTGSIQNFSTPWIVTGGPIPFSLLVRNTSNHFIVPTGDIVIQDMWGQNVGRISLLPVNILANSQRLVPDTKSKSFTDAIWPEKALLGIYRAHLRILLSNEGPLFEKNIYFIALPIPAIIGIILGIIIITLIVLRVKQRLKE